MTTDASPTFDQNPTLKVRFAMDGTFLGRSCHDVAQEMAEASPFPVSVLDAKWGRKPSDWRNTATTLNAWGRVRLVERDVGFVDAVRMSVQPDTVEARLLAIIDGLTR